VPPYSTANVPRFQAVFRPFTCVTESLFCLIGWEKEFSGLPLSTVGRRGLQCFSLAAICDVVQLAVQGDKAEAHKYPHYVKPQANDEVKQTHRQAYLGKEV
jgi:hypothetical protein